MRKGKKLGEKGEMSKGKRERVWLVRERGWESGCGVSG